MLKFDRFQIEDLKEYLYYSHIHDAKIESLKYNRKKRILTIETVNQIYNTRINLTFEEVRVVLSINSNEHGSCETIISLTAEEDYSYLQNCTKVCGNCLTYSLYLLFQMFSGDELHIVSEKVFIENVK